MRVEIIGVITAAQLALGGSAIAQLCPGSVPAADSCTAPLQIPGTPGQHVALVDASAATGNTTICTRAVGRTVWFEVAPEVSGPMTVSTCHPGTAYDTVFQIYSGGNSECQGMTIEDCEDDSTVDRCNNGCSFFGSEIVLNVVAGVRYRIEVGSYGDNEAGCPLCLGLIVTIGSPCGDAPTNIVCDTATELPGTAGAHEALVDVQDAIVFPGEATPSCVSSIGNSVWFQATPDVSGPLTFSTCHPNTHYDTVVAAYRGTCGTLVNVDCNDDDFGIGGPACVSECGKPNARSSTVTFDATAGETYFFQVGSYNDNSAGCELCLGATLTVAECDQDGDCDDGNPCTADSCSDFTCVNAPELFGSPCPADANECTQDICNGEGSCAHPPSPQGTACGDQSAMDCDGPDICDGAGVCAPNLAPYGTPCDTDNVECTDDICNLDGVCTHPPGANGTPCGDPTATDCNNPDTCLDGICQANLVPSGMPCADDDNECTRDECIAGVCGHAPLDAGTPCGSQTATDCDRPDACNGAGACEANFVPAGTSCSDGIFCNGEELCDGAGVCDFGPPPCGPDVACVEEAGRCETEPVPGACRDPACDVDGDSDVDSMDHTEFTVCLSGPEIGVPADPPWCGCFDHDGDESITLGDWATFQNCYSGADSPAELVCDGQLPESLRPDEKTHLAAVGISVDPAYPVPGESVRVLVDVRNNGAESVSSVEVVIEDGGSQIDSQRTDVGSGETRTLEFSWTASATEGEVILTAVVDPARELIEGDRIDNAASTTVLVSSPPPSGADFAITDLTYYELPDRPVVPRVAIHNGGTEGASAPLVFANDDVLIAELVVDLVPAGETVWVDLPWPAGATPGRFSAEINPRYKSVELDPNDNVFTQPFTLNADLRVEDLTVHALKYEPGRQLRVTVSFRVVNGANGPINIPFQTTIDLGSVGTFHVMTPSMGANETIYMSRTAIVPSAVAGFDGRFDIRVETDSQNAISEINEVNNVAASRFNRSSPEIGHWVSIGPRRLTGGLGAIGRFQKLAATPSGPNANDPLIIYAGAPSGSSGNPGGCGIWKSADGGQTWDPVADAMPSLAVFGLAIADKDPNRVYAVTDEGVFRTEDAGVSWRQISTQNLQASGGGGTKLLIDPDDPDRMYIPVQSQGIRRSADGGVTWPSVLGNGNGTGLIMDPNDSRVLHATLRDDVNFARTGVWRSTNGGDDWTQLTGCPGGRLPTVTDRSTVRIARSGSRLYASYKTGSASFVVYRTTEIACSVGGRQERFWEKVWEKNGAGRDLASAFFADPDDASYVYASGVKFYVSTDGGRSFKRMPGPQPHDDFHDFVFDPRDSRKLYVACDGGIYYSNNRGAANSWSFIGEGVSNIEVYDIANARTDPGVIIGGTQDNGTMRYDGMSTLWKQIRGGDGSTVDIDPTTKSILYSMNQFACSISRKVGSADWAGIACGLPSGNNICRNLHYQVNPVDPKQMLASCQNTLWEADDPMCSKEPNCDAGTTGSPLEWSQQFTPPAGNGGISRSAVDPSVDLYYAGTWTGRIYAGPSGANYERVFRHPGGRGVTDIEIDPLAPQFFYASFGGSNANRVYRFRRNAAAPREADVDPQSLDAAAQAQRIPNGLSVRTVAVDRNTPFTIFAGTSNGVYRGRSTDGGATWNWDFYNDGMPPAVDVKDLEIHPTTGVMRAATLGRGAYEVLTAPPIGTRLAAAGRLNFLRVHDVGTGFGTPGDFLDGEVIVGLDTHPELRFGHPLRTDSSEAVHGGMLEVLRNAFTKDRRVRVEYIRTGFRNGRIVRVIQLP